MSVHLRAPCTHTGPSLPGRSWVRHRHREAHETRFLSRTNAEVGDKIPNVRLSYFASDGRLQDEHTHDMFAGKKVVILAVPGAFLPTCSMKHLPGFIERADEMKEQGVDVVACVSVNDAFVMDAWGKSLGADGNVIMLADGTAAFAKAMGAELDLVERNVGIRSRRYAMVVDDLQIKGLNLEEGGEYTISGAEDILPMLTEAPCL